MVVHFKFASHSKNSIGVGFAMRGEFEMHPKVQLSFYFETLKKILVLWVKKN